MYGPLLLLLPADELTVIPLHSAIRDLMTGPVSLNSAVQAQEMQLLKVKPMVFPLRPWRSIDSGGLLFTCFCVMRMYCEAQLRMLREADASSPQGMRQVSLTRQEIDLS